MKSKSILKFIVSKYPSVSKLLSVLRDPSTEKDVKEGLNLVPLSEVFQNQVSMEYTGMDKSRAIRIYKSSNDSYIEGGTIANGEGAGGYNRSIRLSHNWQEFTTLIFMLNGQWQKNRFYATAVPVNVSWLKYSMEFGYDPKEGNKSYVAIGDNWTVLVGNIYDKKVKTADKVFEIYSKDSRYIHEIWGIK